jgi:hypothetical protein
MPYFTHENVDRLSDIESLYPENWNRIPTDTKDGIEERLEALRECDRRIAEFEGRPETKIQWAGDRNSPEFAQERDSSYGWKGGYHAESNTIYVSSEVLLDDNPYDAINTLCHEEHHAYQAYALKNEGFHKNETELSDWREGFENARTMPRIMRDEECSEDEAHRIYREQGHEKSAYLVGHSCAEHLKSEHDQVRSRTREAWADQERAEKEKLALQEEPSKKEQELTEKSEEKREKKPLPLCDPKEITNEPEVKLIGYHEKDGEIIGTVETKTKEHYALHGFSSIDDAQNMSEEEKKTIEEEIKADIKEREKDKFDGKNEPDVKLVGCYEKDGELLGVVEKRAEEQYALHGFSSLEEARSMPEKERSAIEEEIKDDIKARREEEQKLQHDHQKKKNGYNY